MTEKSCVSILAKVCTRLTKRSQCADVDAQISWGTAGIANIAYKPYMAMQLQAFSIRLTSSYCTLSQNAVILHPEDIWTQGQDVLVDLPRRAKAPRFWTFQQRPARVWDGNPAMKIMNQS